MHCSLMPATRHPSGHSPILAGLDIAGKKLIRVADLQDVRSSFVMELIKSTTALPLEYAILKNMKR